MSPHIQQYCRLTTGWEQSPNDFCPKPTPPLLYDELAHQGKAMVVAEQKSSSLHLVQDRALEAVAASRQRSSRSRLIQDFAQMVAVP